MVSGFTSLMFVGLLPITTIYDKVSQLLMTGLFDFYPLQLYMIKLVSYL